MKRLNVALGGFLFAFVFALNCFWVSDADTWWHLKTGQLIWGSGVPRADPFSYVLDGRPWVTFEWLAQAVFYALFAAGGPAALTAFKAALAAGAFVLLWSLSPGVWPTVVFGLAALAARVFFVERPYIFDFALVAVVLRVLWREPFDRPPPRRLLWGLPALAALWANLHGGAALLCPVLTAVAAGAQWLKDPKVKLGRWAGLCALSTAAMILNPHGTGVFSQFWATLRFPARHLIAEWNPIAFHFRDLYALFLAGGAAAAFLLAPIRPAVSAWVVLLGLASLRMQRNIPLFLLAASPAIAGLWAPRRGGGKAGAACAALALCLAAWAHTALLFPHLARRAGFGADEPLAGAAAFVERAGLQGRMFNEYDAGGYLIWRLWPERKVFVDGRSLEYGPEVVRLALSWWQPRSWEELERRFRFDYALVRRHESGAWIARNLDESADWVPAYWDDRASVYLRRTAGNAAAIRRHGYALIKPGRTNFQYLEPALKSARERKRLLAELARASTEAPECLNARLLSAYVLMRDDRPEEAERAAEAALAAAPREAQAALTLGWIRERRGDLSGAEEAYRAALGRLRRRQRPTVGADLANNLGGVLERKGDRQAARESYRLALRWNPDQGDARANLRRLSY